MGREVERQGTDTPARALLEQHVGTVDVRSSRVAMRQATRSTSCRVVPGRAGVHQVYAR